MDISISINTCLIQFIKNNINFEPNGYLIEVNQLNSVDIDNLCHDFIYRNLCYKDYFNELVRMHIYDARRFRVSIISRINDIIARQYYYSKIETLKNVEREMSKIMLNENFNEYYNPQLKYKLSDEDIYLPELLRGTPTDAQLNHLKILCSENNRELIHEDELTKNVCGNLIGKLGDGINDNYLNKYCPKKNSI